MTLFIVELELEVTHKPSDPDAGPLITLHPITRVVSAPDQRAAGEKVLATEFARICSDDPNDSYALDWQLAVRRTAQTDRA